MFKDLFKAVSQKIKGVFISQEAGLALAGGAMFTGICFLAGGTGFREKAAGMLPDALCLLVEPFCQNTFSPENFKVQNKKLI